MSKYVCNLCSKQFKTKSNYIQHIYRLIPCNDVNNSEKCQYCSKTFSHKYNRLRHENEVCHIKINLDNKQIQENKMKELEETNKNLEEKNKQLNEKLIKIMKMEF